MPKPAPEDAFADLPPPFSVRVAAEKEPPVAQAIAAAADGELGAGDILWREDERWLHIALVLEPDRPVGEGAWLLTTWLEAARLALVSLLPPLVMVEVEQPRLLLNRATAGHGGVHLPSEPRSGGVPPWAVLSLSLRLRLPAHLEPGNRPAITALSEEGGGAIASPAIITEVARHLLLRLNEMSAVE